MKIYLIRHGQTEWNRIGKLQGWFDSELSLKGKQQAYDLSRLLADKQIDAVFTSDLGRAKTTASIIFPNRILFEDERFREIYLGNWQGKDIQDLEANTDYQTYISTPHLFKSIHTESITDVQKRMVDALLSISEYNYQKVAIVSHGVAISCLLNALSNKPLSKLWETPMLEGASYVLKEIDSFELRKIKELFETSHLSH